MMTTFSNTPKLKMDRRKFPLRRHLDCENQLRIAKVMIFIITGNISNIVYINYNRSHVTENAYYSHIFACNFLVLSDICMKFE